MNSRCLPVAIYLAMAVLTAASAEAEPVKLYVSASGSDRFSGRLTVTNSARTDGPLATIDGARDAIRRMKSGGGVPPGGVVVEISEGIYELRQPIVFSAEDSGTPTEPVMYRGSGQVRLVGGRVVTGWKRVTDPSVLGRLDPAARGKVMQADLRALGITDFGEMKSALNWAQSECGLELFFCDQRMTIARWPNQGYEHVIDLLPDDPSGRSGRFVYEGDRPARWTAEKDGMLHGYWFYDWADQRFRIESIDAQKKQIALQDFHHGYGMRKGQWYYAYNLLCELDQPGEWYLDRDTGILYFWPPKPLKSGRAMVSILPGIATMKGVSNVTLQGLTFEAARGHSIVMEDCSNVVLRGCTIRNGGHWAVRVTGGRRCGVQGCDIYDMGEGGILLGGGDRPTLTPAGHFADNNHVHHCGRWNPLYQPGIQLAGVGQRATHNLIDNLPHTAIGFTENDHTIEYNEIHSVCQQANDNGAIYTSSYMGGPPMEDWTMRGHRIRFNYLHDLYGLEGKGCQGVYLDDCFSSAEVYGNIFARVHNGILIGGGRDNPVENNVFYDCGSAFSIDARGLGWASNIEPELVRLLKAMPYQGPIWSARYPELVNILNDEPMVPKGNKVLHNVSWRGKWGSIEPICASQVTVKDNLLDVDPLFVDSEHGDFRLNDDSPAWKSGFKRIPVERIGLYRSVDRASWPVNSDVEPMPQGHRAKGRH